MADRTLPVVIVGGGHNGLAMSRRLTEAGIDHVVLEQGSVGDSWRTQRWDSFTLLTPNWLTQLPGRDYEGDDPDGFMGGSEIASWIDDYARFVDAPVREGTTVTSVGPEAAGYRVETDDGPWRCRAVVLASGAHRRSKPPAFAAEVPPSITTVDPLSYRHPDELPDGGVLVVGAAATGVQLAEEIQASGRPVTLAVGEHVRLPRRYRGHDIQHWMTAIGRLDERYDEVEEILRARAVASPQLVGSAEHRTLDLNRLTDAGVELRGRLGGIRDGVALFSGGLGNHGALADQKLGRLLDEIDEWIDSHGVDAPAPDPRPAPTRMPSSVPLTLDLTSGEIRSVVWATGFQPDLSYVDLPVFDGSGRIQHDGGVVTGSPGVYFVGASFLRRRKSSFIHGAVEDSAELAAHLRRFLDGRSAADQTLEPM